MHTTPTSFKAGPRGIRLEGHVYRDGEPIPADVVARCKHVNAYLSRRWIVPNTEPDSKAHTNPLTPTPTEVTNAEIRGYLAASTTAPGPDTFSLTPTPDALEIEQGASDTVAIDLAVTAGVAQDVVVFTLTGAPAGVTGVFDPVAAASGAATELTLTVAVDVDPDEYELTVHGVADSGESSTVVTLTVVEPAP